jgi:lipopolysaccharide transport protein LptA
VDQQKVQAQAESIQYFINSQRVELSGNAELKQGDSNISSDTISYFSAEQLFQAKPDESQGEKKRVQVVIPAPRQKAANDEDAKL